VKFREIVSRLEKIEILRRLRFYELAKQVGVYHGQMPILEYVIEHDGCTQKQIADALMVTPASIATSTKRMQKSGLITKKVDENNLRNNTVSATETGAALSEKWSKAMAGYDERMQTGFSEEELAQLLGYLDRLIANIECCGEKGMDTESIRSLRNKMKNADKEIRPID